MSNLSEKRWYLLILLLACSFTFILTYVLFCQRTQQMKPPASSLKLNALKIKGQDVQVTNKYIGFVEAINKVQVVPYIDGYLHDVLVKPGQIVKENDLLVKIEDSLYKAKLEAAEAQVLQAEALFNYCQDYYNRVKKSGKKAFSEIDIENAQNNFLQAEATLKNAKANRNLADINFHYAQIRAPISGLVGNFNLSKGDYVAPAPQGNSLLYIVQTDPIRVVFSLTDTEYLKMKTGGQLFKDSVIKLTLADGVSYPYEGAFQYTDNQLDKATDSLAVYAYFKNSDTTLLPNAFVTVEVINTFKDSVLLDKNLIKMRPDGYFLTIARDNKLLNVPVHVLSEKDNQYVLENTFSPEDLLILDDVPNIETSQSIQFNILKS